MAASMVGPFYSIDVECVVRRRCRMRPVRRR